MHLTELLKRLKKIKVKLETTTHIEESGQTVYLLVAVLPEFPFGRNKNRWYPLIVSAGQTFIEPEEIDALLRHLWHGSSSEFRDTLDKADPPDTIN